MTITPPKPTAEADQKSFPFKKLVEREHELLYRENDATRTAAPSASNEPWVRFTSRDFFGLALSGGGVRSATFNLGLLQSLDEKDILDSVDYLSTVSGGGYVGGFWSAWLLRRSLAKKKGEATFPNPQSNPPDTAGGLSDPREPVPIRHLREYSRFIIPRLGFKEFETWNAVITILGGVIPSIVTSLCLLTLLFHMGHFYAHFLIFRLSVAASTVSFFLGTFFVQLYALFRWKRIDVDTGLGGAGILTMSVGFSVLAWHLILFSLVPKGLHSHGLDHYTVWHVRPLAFAPAFAWGASALALIVIRALVSRFGGKSGRGSLSAQIDRAASLCLAPAVVAVGMGLVWELGLILKMKIPDESLTASIAGTTVAGSLLFSLRSWLAKQITDPGSSSLGERLAANLKPLIPRILSCAVVVGLVLISVLVLQEPWSRAHALPLFYTCGAEFILALLLFDPLSVGMHDFYRQRIRDCFLSGARARPNGAPDPTKDDPTLGDLYKVLDDHAKSTPSKPEEPPSRIPIHLVCCTANNLAGDTLTGLYRGSRSAVLSPFGISLGGTTAPLDDLRLSSALTASAAAFNSQMGQMSMDWGPAVAFAMSSFNLRLGLWVPHPSNPTRRQFNRLPGLAFLYELFGMTNCDPVPGDEEGVASERAGFLQKQRRKFRKQRQKFNYIHLSDGGHFENLAIYELVRRHCRYIIVSDCAADEDIKFDDLGNALRRVREDFGVQIELDVEALRPGADGNSIQHAVVGTIHYDGLYGTDKGTILYIKPTITGDEPADVLQHHSRYTHFPHDSTAEQFYNEAQWESYRCLGEHVGRAVFSFVEKAKPGRQSFVENLFLGAGESWRPALPRQDEVYTDLTEKCRSMENDIRQNAPEWLRLEFYPEVVVAVKETKAAPPREHAETTQTVYFLMQVIQLMEDVWMAAELDKYWSHPMSQGWMTYFHRWTATPSFRMWWPVLRPMYSNGLREFVKERFGIRIQDGKGLPSEARIPGPSLAKSEPMKVRALTGMASAQWVRLHGPFPDPEQPAIDYSLTLTDGVTSLAPIQVAFLRFTEKERMVSWNCADLFVPYALVGGGITARFLDEMIAYFRIQKHERICVTIGDEDGRFVPNRAARWALVETINFYKSRGFVYEDPENSKSLNTRLRLTLDPPKKGENVPTG
jgi:hypothetical protein